MVKNQTLLLQKGVSQAVIDALEKGKGNRAVGGSNRVNVGQSYKITGVEFREGYMAPRNSELSATEWSQLTPEEQKAQGGKLVGWFVMTTTNGEISFTQLFGNANTTKPETWVVNDGKVTIDGNTYDAKVETDGAIDVTKLWTPSTRFPKAFIEGGCDGLLDASIKCVARLDYFNPFYAVNSDSPYNAKLVAFVVVK